MTAATGTAKIAPTTPWTLSPMITDSSTTTGWMPTESAITRGWMMFMTTNQPTSMMASIASTGASGVTAATTTGGAHDTNGPKNGIIWRMATMTAVAGQ